MVITMDIKKLKALAESVYIKDWVLDSRLYRVTTKHAETIAEATRLRFAEYIAAVSPSHLLQLISMVDKTTTAWVIYQPRYQDTPVYFCGFEKNNQWDVWALTLTNAVRFMDAASAAAVMHGVDAADLRIKEITLED